MRNASVEKIKGSGEDIARQYNNDWSSVDDVDNDESSVLTHNNYVDVSNNGSIDGSDISEGSDGEASQYSDDGGVKHPRRKSKLRYTKVLYVK